jgi:hypothetical protein
MDPYLEGSLCMTVHTQLSAEIARQLAPKLRPKYLAFTTERFVMEMPEGVAVATASVYPDVSIAEAGPGDDRGAEVAIAQAPVRIATAMPLAVPHVTVEVRDTADRQLVTAIAVTATASTWPSADGSF